MGAVLQPAAERCSVRVPTAGTVRHHITTHIREMRAYSCMRAWKTCAFCVIRPTHHFFFLRAGTVAVAECVSVAECVWLISPSRHTTPPYHTTTTARPHDVMNDVTVGCSPAPPAVGSGLRAYHHHHPPYTLGSQTRRLTHDPAGETPNICLTFAPARQGGLLITWVCTAGCLCLTGETRTHKYPAV